MRSGEKRQLNGDQKNRRQNILGNFTAVDLCGAAALVRTMVQETSVRRVNLNKYGIEMPCLLKMENETPTLSFKVRGASYFMSKLSTSPEFEKMDFVTASTGNHGISLAWCAKSFGKSIIVVAPKGIPEHKLKKLKSFGANVILEGETLDDSIRWVRQHMTKEVFVPSFNPNIALGHSTLGTELFHSHPSIATLFFPIGVGSGISGLCISRDVLSPSTKIIGVVPEASAAWARSLEAGSPTFTQTSASLADGLRTACPDSDVFEYLKTRLETVLTVSEDEIIEAQNLCIEECGVTAEGAGVVGLAGLLKFSRSSIQKSQLGAILCG